MAKKSLKELVKGHKESVFYGEFDKAMNSKDRFVKRKILRTEVERKGWLNIARNSLYGTILGGGGILTLGAINGADISQIELDSPGMILFYALGGIAGFVEGLNKYKTKINYYDDGLRDSKWDEHGSNSIIYDEEMYNKKLAEEDKMLKEKGYLISDEEWKKKEKGIIYDDGLRFLDTRMGGLSPDRYIHFRTPAFKKLFAAFSKDE